MTGAIQSFYDRMIAGEKNAKSIKKQNNFSYRKNVREK